MPHSTNNFKKFDIYVDHEFRYSELIQIVQIYPGHRFQNHESAQISTKFQIILKFVSVFNTKSS